MALSRVLLKRLNSEDDPLPKRLKLAEAAFSAIDLPIVQREDQLLDWLCTICVTNRCAWRTLNNCLKSACVDIKANVKQCLADVLMRVLNDQTETVHEEVLECCGLILTNNSMRQYFIRKPEDLGLLVNALLKNMLKHNHFNEIEKECNQLPESCELSSAQSSIIINVIESIIQIYKQSIATKEKLRIIFARDILYPMCSIIDYRCTDSSNKLGIAAYKCIQQLLLRKNRYTENKRIAENDCSTLDLFRILSKKVETLSLRSNVLTYLFIFRAAIGTYKSDVAALDTFFRSLINSSGRYKWEILNVILKLLNDVTLDFENTVESVTLAEYFQNLINDILTHVTCVHYETLAQLAYVNPLLIEKNIPNILQKILMQKQAEGYTNLLVALLHASVKLRREQMFISHFLAALKQHVAVKKTRTMSADNVCNLHTFIFLPDEFKAKLAKSIGNMVNLQVIVSLRTLLHYLNTDCAELLQCNGSCKNVSMLKATVELLVTFLKSMQIFEHTTALSTYETFVNTLNELGCALSLLINKALCLSHNKDITVILLTAVQSLSEMQNMLKYYVPKVTLMRVSLFPIPDDPWQQLIQRISNFGEDNCKNSMNKLILHRIKLNASDETPIKLRSLIGGLEHSWRFILKHNASVLSLLNDKEISKVTYLLLADMTSSEESFHEWLSILDKECIQENKRFVLCLLGHVLVEIGQCMSMECTKSITGQIDIKLLMKNESDENNTLGEILLRITKELTFQQELMQTNVAFYKIELYLKILFHIPMIYFSHNIRTLIFLVVYCISKECEGNDKVSALCNVIFSELLEKTGIDIFQYIKPAVLVNQLSQNKAFAKACEFSLRNVTTYATLKNLIKSCAQQKEAICIVLECVETIKPKLSTEQKIIFKKAEKRLTKVILNVLPKEINDVFDIRCLVAVLKVMLQTGKITETLKKLTESTLRNIFEMKKDLSNPINDALLQQGICLANIVLYRRKAFEISDTTIENLWSTMLKYPCKTLLKPLLASTELKEFHKLLKQLHDKTVDSLSRADETTWTNLLIIWSNIMKTDMRMKRSKMRFSAINDLFEIAQRLHIPDGYWPNLLRLLHDTVGVKHLLIPNVTIDLIMTIGLKSLERASVSSCENALALCESLLKIRTNLITDRLPTLLLLYRGVVRTVVQSSKNMADKFDEHRFRCLALNVEKLTSLLVKLKKSMIRLSPYVVADLLQLLSEGTVPSYIKIALQNSLCQLIGICDQHGIALLSRALSTSLQEIFKVQLDMFNKFHKYSGKI